VDRRPGPLHRWRAQVRVHAVVLALVVDSFAAQEGVEQWQCLVEHGRADPRVRRLAERSVLGVRR
jgi:hypothetical protein